MMLLSKYLTAVAILSAVAEGSTRVAVLEFGKGGAVSRTNVRDPETSVNGVISFWNALHRTGRRQLQYAGMSVVPGLFGKADAGLVIGLGGRVDLDEMVNVASYMSEESAAAVGHMEVHGNHCSQMMAKLDNVQELQDTSEFKANALKSASSSGLSGIKAVVSSANAAEIDQEVASMLQEIERSAEESGQTIVVHLVVDEDDAHSRRRLLSRRRLEDEQNPEEGNNNQGENNGNNQDGQNNAEDDDMQNQMKQYSGYYGYGYYKNGEWVSPYKTMFQIQYFNVVLWTAIALVVALFYTIYLMTNMPLEADTLLFGESAKMIGDD